MYHYLLLHPFSVSKPKGNKRQKTQDIVLHKERGESLGLILSRDPYQSSGVGMMLQYVWAIHFILSIYSIVPDYWS